MSDSVLHMIKLAISVLVLASLLLSPVIAGVSDLACFADTTTVAAKADQDNANTGPDQLARDHICCTTHVHFGTASPANDHLPSRLLTTLRPPLLADQFLVAFGPNPLIEPPTYA